MEPGLAIVWRFRCAAGRTTAFEAAYGPEGDWARLFRRAPGYRGTELLRPAAGWEWYLTIDRWRAEADWDAFRRDWAADYAALDRACSGLTEAEELVGRFRDGG